MAANLLTLSNGHVSLEFDPADLPIVKAAIEGLFGSIAIKQFPMAADIKFGGADFTYQNEWNDPSLISGTDLGDQHLRRIFSALSTS